MEILSKKIKLNGNKGNDLRRTLQAADLLIYIILRLNIDYCQCCM